MAFDDETNLLYLSFSDSIRTYQYTNSSLIPNGTLWNQSAFYMMIDVLHSLLFVMTDLNALVALDLKSAYNFTTLNNYGVTTFAINPQAEEIYFARGDYTLFKLLYHSPLPIVLDQSFATLNGLALANETLLWYSVFPTVVGSMQFDGSNRSAITAYGSPNALAFYPGIKRVDQVQFCLVEQQLIPVLY